MKNSDFVKGLGLGMVAGASIGMAIAPKKKRSKSVAGKALRTAGDIVENVSSALGM